MSALSLVELVAQHPFAAGLSRAEVEAITEDAELRTLRPWQELFHEGGRADHCYLVLDGHVGLELHIPHRGTVTVATVDPGQILGVSWLVAPHRWRFDATARTPAHLVALDAAVLRRAGEHDPHLRQALTDKVLATAVGRLEATRHQLVDVYHHGR